MDGRLAASAMEHARLAADLFVAGRFRESFPHFAAAEADLDALAVVGGSLPAGLEALPLHVQDNWLQAIVKLGDEGSLDEATIRSGVLRCDRLLALTDGAKDTDAVDIRGYAHYNRARLLTLLGEHERALPSAIAALEALGRRLPDMQRRNIEKQMRSTIASAYWDLGDHGRAEREFAATLRLALPDDDVTVTELVLQGLQLMYRREPVQLARALDSFPGEAAAAGAPGAEAHCRYARAAAWDATPTEFDTARLLGIADEFLRAARAFADLGETRWQAQSVYSAARPLSAAALRHPEHSAQAEEAFTEAERLLRELGDWHGVGVTAFGLAELRNREQFSRSSREGPSRCRAGAQHRGVPPRTAPPGRGERAARAGRAGRTARRLGRSVRRPVPGGVRRIGAGSRRPDAAQRTGGARPGPRPDVSAARSAHRGVPRRASG